MANCPCPLSTVMGTITDTSCLFNMKEVHRVWVVRGGELIFDLVTPATGTTPTTVTTLPSTSAAWTVLKSVAIAGGGKTLFLPLFGSEPNVTPGGEITTTGLSNSTTHVGFEPSVFSAMFEGLTALQETEINTLKCEGATLEFFFVLFDGSIIGSIDDHASPQLWKGFSIESAMVLMGRSLNGFNENDKNEFKFQILQEWSQSAYKITPASGFYPLTF